MNVKDEFIKWFEPKSPPSYKLWFGKNIQTKFDEMNSNYIKSCGTDLFDVDFDNLQECIDKIDSNIEERSRVHDITFAEYSQKNSTNVPSAIIKKWFIRFLKEDNYDNVNDDCIDNSNNKRIELSSQVNNFTYECDLQNALISQSEEIFNGFKIYGDNGEGIEYPINGKRIDLLLEKENDLLAIELKAGKADFRVFGQISMYLQLLEEKFNDKTISGIIMAGEIDDTLKIASKRDKNIRLMAYRMELKVDEIEK
jgi:hypothetical protein